MSCHLRAIITLSSGLAALIRHYVDAINTPDMIPSVQTAWENFVMSKCSEARQASLGLYKEMMEAELSGKLPCDNDVIREKHEMALQKGLALFEEETFGIAATTTRKDLEELMVGKNKFHFLREKMAIWFGFPILKSPLPFSDVGVTAIPPTSTSEKRSGNFKIGKPDILKQLAKQEHTSGIADHIRGTGRNKK